MTSPKQHTISLRYTLIAFAFGLALNVSHASAQYYPPGGHDSWHAYEQQSRQAWMNRYEYYHGPMSAPRRALHDANVAVRRGLHEIARFFDRPDYRYYDRWDRAPVVRGAPSPYGGVYARYNYPYYQNAFTQSYAAQAARMAASNPVYGAPVQRSRYNGANPFLGR